MLPFERSVAFLYLHNSDHGSSAQEHLLQYLGERLCTSYRRSLGCDHKDLASSWQLTCSALRGVKTCRGKHQGAQRSEHLHRLPHLERQTLHSRSSRSSSCPGHVVIVARLVRNAYFKISQYLRSS